MSATAPEQVRTTVHELEVRRGRRRGTITKLHHRIDKALSEGPERINQGTLKDLAAQLSTTIDAHTALQTQLDELYDLYDDLRTPQKAEDDESLLDLHITWRARVNDVIVALPLRAKAVSILNSADSYLSDPVPDSQYFRSLVDKLHLRHVEVSDGCAGVFQALSDLKEICDSTEAKMAALLRLTANACKDAPPASVPAPPTPPSSDRDALKIELPSFDGDPFKWANFRTMFCQTIEKRARGHTRLEVKGLLIKAVKHPEGLKILHTLPSDDVPLSDMLDKLEAVFGAADVLAPLIIAKILSISTCSLSASDVDRLYESLILPYNKFCSLVGDSLGDFLAMMVASFMSADCRREWTRHRPPDSAPSMDNLTKFVDAQRKELRGSHLLSPPSPSVSSPVFTSSTSAHLLSPSALSPSRPPTPKKSASKTNPPRGTAQRCPVCGELHSLHKCSVFVGYDLDKRNQVVRDKRLCLNCLGEGHGCKSCPSRFACRTCSGKHHSLLHRDRDATPTKAPSISAMTAATVPQNAPSSRQPASLYSAIVAFDRGGRKIHARALLDAGAAIPMMSESLAATLNLKRRHDPIPVTGISGATTRCEFSVTCDLYSLDLICRLPNLTYTLIEALEPVARPANAQEIRKMPELSHFKLADEELGGRVDLVLGISQLTTLTSGAPFRVGELGALPTHLGLCLSCPLEAGARPAVNTVSTTNDTPADVARLWELDRVPEAPTVHPEEQAALDHFDATHHRTEDGRYSVSLPRTDSPPELGDSRPQAISRLLANEKSLRKRGKLQSFCEVIQEYFTLGHAEHVPTTDLKLPCYYMPVHAVVKEGSTTTKLRAVFDASARTPTGVSLNDQLLPGPNLYPPPA